LFSVWEEKMPSLKWEVLVGGAEGCNEVVLECADCTFGTVGTVTVGGDELQLDFFG